MIYFLVQLFFSLSLPSSITSLRYSKKNKAGKVIFISHNVPYGTPLGIIRDPRADPQVFGKNYGSKLVREIIEKYQPVLHIAGHMHENQGSCRIRRTLCIEAGPALEGKGTIIDFDESVGRIKKVEFIK